MLEGGWGFDQLWILLGLGGIAFSIVTGAAFIGPESGRMKALLESRTLRPNSPLWILRAMDLYELLLAIHILAVVVWVGGATSLQVLAIRATGSGDPVRMATFAGEAEWVGMRIFMPSSIVVLLAGIALVLEGSWGFDQLWILIGLAGIAFSIVVGAAFLGPESGRLKALMEARGAEDTEVKQRLERIFMISRIELGVLLLIVLDMAIKPGA